MSSQKGNINRQRPQKHQNRTAFKNTLHDTSQRTKTINSTQISNVCERCKEQIQWKIKYKKYKPLTQLKTCVKCSEKSVRHAYHVMCRECAKKFRACAKCLKTNIPTIEENNEDELKKEMDNLLKTLPERKRRTFLRFLNKGIQAEDNGETPEISNVKEALEKLRLLSTQNESEENDIFTDDSNSDSENDD